MSPLNERIPWITAEQLYSNIKPKKMPTNWSRLRPMLLQIFQMRKCCFAPVPVQKPRWWHHCIPAMKKQTKRWLQENLFLKMSKPKSKVSIPMKVRLISFAKKKIWLSLSYRDIPKPYINWLRNRLKRKRRYLGFYPWGYTTQEEFERRVSDLEQYALENPEDDLEILFYEQEGFSWKANASAFYWGANHRYLTSISFFLISLPTSVG